MRLLIILLSIAVLIIGINAAINSCILTEVREEIYNLQERVCSLEHGVGNCIRLED